MITRGPCAPKSRSPDVPPIVMDLTQEVNFDDDNLVTLTPQERGGGIVDMFDLCTGLFRRLIATKESFMLPVRRDGVDHNLWHQRRTSVVKMYDSRTDRGVMPHECQITCHRLFLPS